MITLHGEEVKVGDRVWHWFKGWGEVTELEEEAATLFWQPIEFEIPKKPKQKEKAWQWICKTEGKYWLTYGYYATKWDILERTPKTKPIEPYLPSEIEREVKE